MKGWKKHHPHSKAWKVGLEPQSLLHTYTHPHPPIQTAFLFPSNRDVSDSNNTKVGDWNGVVLKAPWAPAPWWLTRSWSKSGLRSSPAPDISHSWGANVKTANVIPLIRCQPSLLQTLCCFLLMLQWPQALLTAVTVRGIYVFVES